MSTPRRRDDCLAWADALSPVARAAVLVVPVVVAVLAGLAVAPPDVVGATSPPDQFSAERALDTLRDLARAPRPAGSPEHARVRERLVASLTALGLEVRTQEGSSCSHAVAQTRCAHVVNVAGRLRGRGRGDAILLSAHYDSAAHSPGAADNGAGVAALLETARALRTSPPIQNDVIFSFPDAEEEGLLGSRLFTRAHPWRDDVRVALNFEARGTAGPSMMYETSVGNARLVDVIAASSRRPIASALTYTASRFLPNDTDATVYKAAGWPTLSFALAARTHPYHHPTDTVANLDPRSLQHHGEQALAVVRHLGNTPLRDLVSTEDVVFFDLAGLAVVRYGLGVGRLLVLLSLLLAAVVTAAAVRRGWASWRGVAGAVGTLGVATLVAVAVVSVPRAVVAWQDPWRVTMAHATLLHVGYLLVAAVASAVGGRRSAAGSAVGGRRSAVGGRRSVVVGAASATGAGGVSTTLRRLPGIRRSWPSVTTVSPACRPSATTASRSSIRVSTIGRFSTAPSGCTTKR